MYGMKINENGERVWTLPYFCGEDISKHDIEMGCISYKTLAETFDCILCNNIIEVDEYLFDNLVNGNLYNDYDEMFDIYQWYIIDNDGYDILNRYTDEIVFYSEKLDCYVWGVTHYGTSWNSVPTDIKIELNNG